MQVVSEIHATKIEQIGSGQGMNSTVYLAHDPQLDGYIAVKEIPLDKFNDASEYFTEAQSLYKNKHPNIVPVMYACKDANHVRIVMPYFQNGSVQDYLNRGPLTVKQIIYWSYQFLLGLHHIHSNGYIHYDIKPTNLLIHDNGSVMLSDFGQARSINILGVAEVPPLYPYHFPPEAFQYSHTTKQADIYQVGMTLYRMCNGDIFFKQQKPMTPEEIRDKTLNGTYPNRNKFLPHVPRHLKRIIKKALQVVPDDRYQTAMDIINELGQVDKLLDWQYYDTDNAAKWVSRNECHEYIISIEENNNNWHVQGKTIRLSDGLKRTKTAWCDGPFPTHKQAMNSVSRMFSKMEGGS